MILLTNFIDTLSNTELLEYITKLKDTDNSDNTINITNILLSVIAVIGSFIGGVWGYIKLKESNKQQRILKNTEIDKLSKQADIESKMDFQQKIVNKFFEEYVKQNTWITDQFAKKFEVLLENLQTQNKLMKDIYAQTDIFRKELRSYEKETTSNLKKIEGILSKK